MNLPKQQFTFSKERLCSRKTIEKIFDSGKAINENPFRLLWVEAPNEENVYLKIAISVPKKNFKKAVDRNKIKRQIREVYRLNKNKFFSTLENPEKRYAAIIIYTGRVLPDRKEMEAKIFVTLQRFAKETCKK
ncbi:MAG TPA: ribonuclease P protein component [Bacteroidia bacterium]|nr:ribonuclease P protein component [Bacteroidia bacterium]